MMTPADENLKTQQAWDQVDALNALAWELRMQEPERSIRLSNDAYACAEAAGYLRGMARGLLAQGVHHLLFAEPEVGVTLLSRALGLSREAGDRQAEATSLNCIGMASSLRADHAAAMPHYAQALAIRREIGDRAGEATTLNNIGNIYLDYGDHSAAAGHISAALKIYREIGDPQGEAMALNNLGNIHTLFLDYATAYDCHMAGLEIYQRLENPGNIATILCSLAEDHYHLGRSEEARNGYQQALSLARTIRNERVEAEALARLGLLTQRAGEHDQAREQYRQALEIARRTSDGECESLILYHFGLCSRDTGDFAGARQWLEQAAALAKELQMKKRAYEAHEALAGVCEQQGDFVGAFKHHCLFHQLEKEVFNQEADGRTKALMLQMEMDKTQKEAELYRQRAEMERMRTVELADANEALQFANARLETLATTDPLTGLPNHRALAAALETELDRAYRYGRPFGVLFLDIDHFKAINDTGGHATGDAALQQFAALVRERLRGTDIVGRWGGEEFVALLPETDEAGALAAAEEVCVTVAKTVFAIGGGLRMTCSIGVASSQAERPSQRQGSEGTDIKGPGERSQALVAAADQAMYAAKRLGRNQVRAAGDSAVRELLAHEQAKVSREDIALAGTVEALVALVEKHDRLAGKRTEGTALLAVKMAQELGLTGAEGRQIGLAARLHDIGLLAVPDVLLQKPAPLSVEEQAILQTHPEIGAGIVSHVPSLRALTPLIRAHHEHWDGMGYPNALAGEEIPMGARIIAVADTFCFLTSESPLRRALEPAEAITEIRRGAGTQFDPAVVEALVLVIKGEE